MISQRDCGIFFVIFHGKIQNIYLLFKRTTYTLFPNRNTRHMTFTLYYSELISNYYYNFGDK